MAAITRLGLAGIPRGIYGSFAGKTGAVTPEPTVVQQHGGNSKKHRKASRLPYRGIDDERARLYARFGWEPEKRVHKPAVEPEAEERRQAILEALPPEAMTPAEVDAALVREFARLKGASDQIIREDMISDDEAALMLLLVA